MHKVDWLLQEMGSKKKGRQREGVRMLNQYLKNPFDRELAEDIIADADDALTDRFIRNSGAPIEYTALIGMVGRTVMQLYCTEGIESEKDASFHIGAFVFDAFEVSGEIQVERVSDSRDSYKVYWLGKALENVPVLRATYTEPPAATVKVFDDGMTRQNVRGYNTREFVKHYSWMVRENVPHIALLNKLQGQGWRVDRDQARLIKDHGAPSTLVTMLTRKGMPIQVDALDAPAKGKYSWPDGEDYDGPLDKRIQEVVSKYREYINTISKLNDALGQVLYQSWSFDWRGRVYCDESYFHYQAGDLARSVFSFKDGEVLTERGLWHLKVHAATCYAASMSYKEIALAKYLKSRKKYLRKLKQDGLDSLGIDKMTKEDRVAWVDQRIDSIRTNTKVLPEADAPYQYLRCCLELNRVLSNPEYLCAFPIPQDGSQNGWGHMARITCDAKAGHLTSLTPNEIPTDLYVAVASVVYRANTEWFEAKGLTKMKDIRKLLKRAVMVRAYAAGEQKIAENMQKDAKTEGLLTKYSLTEVDFRFLASETVDAIAKVCAGPMMLRSILQKIAAYENSEHCQKEYVGMRWLTPSGFLVPYNSFQQRDTKIKVTATAGRRTLVVKETILDDNGNPVPDRNKYAAGIAPNFIHSMDAAHLALFASQYHQDFVSVHDSYATGANHVDVMNKLIRSTFHSMYEGWDTDYTKLVEQLTTKDIMKSFVTKSCTFEAYLLGKIPSEILDTDAVLESEYFFS